VDILIIKLGALGDVINTLPLAMALKKQLGAHIHWLVAPLSYPLLKEHQAVEHTILFDRSKGASTISSLLHALMSQQFDAVLDLQRILKSSLFCSVARGKRKIGFDKRRCKELTWLLPFERIPASDPQAHMVHQYLEFAHYLGIHDAAVEWGIETGGHRPEGLPAEFVVLNIGATKAINRWTAKGFSILAQMIHQHHRLPCVLTGGREDAPMARIIQSAAGESVCNLVGGTSLPELIDVIDTAVAVISCDTGPMHLAAALGKKVIALFGPSNHRRTGPYQGMVIRSKVASVPRGPEMHAQAACMAAIRPEHVFRVLSREIAIRYHQ
jgi:ADP-heptose:LPS heptosyltransferase